MFGTFCTVLLISSAERINGWTTITANAVVITESLKVLVVKWSDTLESDRWALPGGVLTEESSPKRAALQHLNEQTSMEPTGAALVQVYTRSEVSMEEQMSITYRIAAEKIIHNSELKSIKPETTEIRFVRLKSFFSCKKFLLDGHLKFIFDALTREEREKLRIERLKGMKNLACSGKNGDVIEQSILKDLSTQARRYENGEGVTSLESGLRNPRGLPQYTEKAEGESEHLSSKGNAELSTKKENPIEDAGNTNNQKQEDTHKPAIVPPGLSKQSPRSRRRHRSEEVVLKSYKRQEPNQDFTPSNHKSSHKNDSGEDKPASNSGKVSKRSRSGGRASGERPQLTSQKSSSFSSESSIPENQLENQIDFTSSITTSHQ